jgi:hypothetical protein
MVKILITFGAGGQNYTDACERIAQQGQHTGLFDKIIIYTESDLRKDDIFWSKHSTFIEENKRGFGYWIWKSYIIKKTMEQMKEDDVLLYLDCGCEISTRKTDDIRVFLDDYIKTDYIIASSNGCMESSFSKMDLIIRLNMENSTYLNEPQIQAGAILFLVCEKVINFISEWYELCCDYHLIDDSPSVNINIDSFYEHRHDQSIFSLLGKKRNIISRDKGLLYPIEYIRNKTGNYTV